MMNYLHYEFDLKQDEAVQITLDKSANVKLLDASNYQRYQAGQPYHYFGGFAESTLVTLRPPHAGHWHVVVDLGGYAGTVRASGSVLSAVS